MKKKKEKKLIWNKIRYYVDFIILICCIIIAINIHPTNISNNFISTDSLNTTKEKTKMIYIFHDYEGNEFIMNDNIHWASSSWDYLFDDEIPNDLKWDDEKNEGSVSIWDLFNESNNGNSQSWYRQEYDSEWVKNNQISIEDIMSDLWITGSNTENVDVIDKIDTGASNEEVMENAWVSSHVNDNSLDIDVWEYDSGDDIYGDFIYIVKEENNSDNNSLIIEKFNGEWNDEIPWNVNELVDYKDKNSDRDVVNEKNIINENNLLIAKSFSFVDEWWVLPTLVPWNDLFFGNSDQALAYIDGSTTSDIANNWYNNGSNENKKSGITIIWEYASCMTPWWYKIKHWESVLAYKQMDSSPNICNIERRFCWKWKLSGTYTQQWCSVNENYTYEQWWDTDTHIIKRWSDSSTSTLNQWVANNSSSSKWEFVWKTRQNDDWSVSVSNDEIWWDFVFDRPNNMYTDFTGNGDNIRPEDTDIELYYRPHRDCTTPRWEKVKDWQFVQAFKHKNWFSDIPCEAQFRLCSVGDLMWTFTESSCKTWDTSFIDWVYGSPTWQTYSEEKLELIKEQIKDEEKNYKKDRKKIWKLSNDDFDDLLYILDENY